MARITFEPPAKHTEYSRAVDWFGGSGLVNWRDGVVTFITSTTAPCDLTIDPTRPETWARAVYEAGVRYGKPLGAAEHLALYGTGMPPPTRGYGKSYTETLVGGVTQQPAGKPVRMCHGTLESPPADNDPGWVYAYMDDTPPPNFFVNGTEYRPVTPS